MCSSRKFPQSLMACATLVRALGRTTAAWGASFLSHAHFGVVRAVVPGQLSSSLARVSRTGALCLAGISAIAHAQSVVFLNPGQTGEAFWEASSDAMRDAAQSLGMQLEIQMAERQRVRPIEQAKQLAARPPAQRPDYVIFTNDYGTGPAILGALEKSGIKAFMAYSSIPAELRAQTGAPRGERYPLWLGSLEPNSQDSGYLTAKALIEQALRRGIATGPDGRLQMVAIAGDRSTTTSSARNAGMLRALHEHKAQVQLMQEVYGDWRQDKAHEQAQVLFARYPEARLVWAGNDLMAFGAMQAWQDKGGTPGKDALFSGINTSERAFALLKKGDLTALSGGHFLAGAWSLVMLYDYHHGMDFAHERLELVQPMFVLFNPQSALAFERLFGAKSVPLNFRPFSKHLNKQLRSYKFDLNQLLQSAF